jgi:2-keto-3-deoxy-L-rhamnonate aldolase RhmA
VRTPSHQVIEVLAARGTRCVMIDTEHSAIGGGDLDAMLAIAAALGVDALVRVPAAEPTSIQRALDGGATGVVVPHVDSSCAADVVRWAHYGGGRGYSGSTRSAGWGTRPIADVLTLAAETTVVVAQVEDVASVADAAAIAATPGLDAVFVGAADLAVALGETSLDAPAVAAACERVIAACRDAGRPIAAFAGTPADVEAWRARGVALVFHGTDQSRLLP